MYWDPKPGTEGRFRKTHCDGCGKPIHEYRNRPKWLCKQCEAKEQAGEPLPSDQPQAPCSGEKLLALVLGGAR